MSIQISGKVGPQILSDGSQADIRQGKSGEVIVAPAHGQYYELASRNLVYAGMTAVTGTTVVAGNVSPVAAAAASILSLYNPANSGYNLEIIKSWVYMVSGTPGAGSVVYNIGYNQNITATSNATSQSTAGGAQTATGRLFTQTALTGSGAQNLLHPIGGAFAGAIAATSPGMNILDNVEGAIVLPPGAVLSIAAPAAGTSWVVTAGFMWAEIKL